MSPWAWAAIAAGVTLAVWAAFVLALLIAGRGPEAKALARLIPDCVVLLRRLMAEPQVPRRHKLLLGAVVAYLALPIDLVPDMIPVAGQLDDAIVVALALRAVLRAAGPGLVTQHWPGPPESRDLILRLTARPRPNRRRRDRGRA
ncbi:MAG TPA: DUF1232 domain-containing protein [Solirubrobacteraceae bacterium]|nr:DUF1232 domain-containing protein [Solirubrobacteraceae bacterium]